MSIKRSPWLSYFNSGGCNGCALEVLAVFNPRFDAERLGCKYTSSPRHADILLVSGPITSQSLPRLLKVKSQMPEGGKIVALGSCAISGGIFKEAYNTRAGLADHTDVDVFVPGCPPRPEAIISGILEALKNED